MAAAFQTTFSNAFSWMKIASFWWKFHWNLFPRVHLTIFQHWFREWLGACQATSHYLNQWCLILMTHICVTRPQWVNGEKIFLFVFLTFVPRGPTNKWVVIGSGNGLAANKRHAIAWTNGVHVLWVWRHMSQCVIRRMCWYKQGIFLWFRCCLIQ